jgi:hypothetical protein
MKKIHYVSGLLMIAFISVHLLNHLFSLAGPAAHIAYMEVARKVYRIPVIEALLLAAVLVQIVSGFSLARRKGFRQETFWGKMQVYSGLFLAFFLTVHTIATFGGRWLFAVDTNFFYAAMVVNLFPFAYFYLPYYALGVIAFFVHMACIHRLKVKPVSGFLHPDRQAYVLIAMGVAVAVLILLAFTDFGRWIEIPAVYQAILGQ